MMLAGKCYRLPNSVRHTSESASSSWRTPQAQDSKSGKIQRGVHHLWPTYVASEATHGGPNQKDSAGKPTLTALVHHLWPTPTACNPNDGESLETWEARRQKVRDQKKNGNGFGTPLTIAVQMWPTPVANDAKNGTLPPATQSRDSIPGALRRAGERGQLNPAWVNCLMGFPPDWCDIDGPLVPDKNNTNGSLSES
jgi:hypothetical protein